MSPSRVYTRKPCLHFQLQLFGENAWQSPAQLLHPVCIDTHFLQIARYRGSLRCGVRPSEVGQQECTLASALFQDGACVGIQEQRFALWQAGRMVPLSDAVRTLLLACQHRSEVSVASPVASRFGSAADIGAYPFVARLTSRFGDLDADGCTSTLALLRYAEQARSLVLFAALDHAGLDFKQGPLGMLVARTGIDVLDRRAGQGNVRLAAGASRLGNSSVALRVAVFDQQGCVAVSESVMVFIRRDDRRPTPLPEKLRGYLSGQACMAV